MRELFWKVDEFAEKVFITVPIELSRLSGTVNGADKTRRESVFC